MTKHPKRPRDFSQAAKLVVDIAAGQVEDRPPTPEEQGKDPAARAAGASRRRHGRKRAGRQFVKREAIADFPKGRQGALV
jgi:hypothetical protein